MDPMSNLDEVEVQPPPQSPAGPEAPTIQRASLADVRKQEEFEVETGVWMKIHMVGGVYLGKVQVTYVANKDLQKEQKRLDDLWRRQHSKPKDYPIPDEVAEDHVRSSWVGRVLHDHADFEETAGVPLAHPEDKKELHKILRSLLEIRTVRAAVLNFIIEEENFNLRELEKTQGNS